MRTCPLCFCSSVKDDGTCLHCAKPVMAPKSGVKWNQEPAASQARVAARSEMEPEGQPLTREESDAIKRAEWEESRAEINRLKALAEQNRKLLRE